MRIKIKIMPNDSDTIAKVVIIDEKNRVLMLKRSKYLKKYPNKWNTRKQYQVLQPTELTWSTPLV